MSNKNNEINKWKIKDVITTVLLSILLIAIQLIINMHGKPLCQHGPIHRIYDVTVRTGLLSALASRKKAFRNPYIHDHNRDHISLDGKLVSPSVLHICRYNMRMHSMERRFFEEGKTSYSFVDRSQPHV